MPASTVLRCLAVATLALGCPVRTVGPAAAHKAPDPTTSMTTTTSTTAVTTVPARHLAVAVPGAVSDLAALDSFAATIGTAPGQVTWYRAWSAGGDFPTAEVSRVAARGAVPELVWEPWDPAQGVNQRAYSLSRIASGAYDAYVTRWARAIASYGRPLVIRFAHEMNGDWYPWAEGVNGNKPGSYVAAWRHVVGIFSSQGVGNVAWLWAPNVPSEGSSLAALYPGDAYVQQVGLDGYNWGTSQSWSSWQDFGEIFRSGVTQLRALTTRPIYISETATTSVGGDKAAWITGMWQWLAAHPEVRGVTWFDFSKESDWRVESSAESVSAFTAGLPGFLAG